MITDRCLAELYEVLRHPGAAYRRELADTERADEVSDGEGALDAIDVIRDLLNQVDEAPSRAKHDLDCWRKHAACLADKIGDVLS